jgi:hypothetical protein
MITIVTGRIGAGTVAGEGFCPSGFRTGRIFLRPSAFITWEYRTGQNSWAPISNRGAPEEEDIPRPVFDRGFVRPVLTSSRAVDTEYQIRLGGQ